MAILGGLIGPGNLLPSGAIGAVNPGTGKPLGPLTLGNSGSTGVGRAASGGPSNTVKVAAGPVPVFVPAVLTGVGQTVQSTPASATAPNASTSYGTIPTNTNGFGVSTPTTAAATVAGNLSSVLPSNLSITSLLLIAAILFFVVME